MQYGYKAGDGYKPVDDSPNAFYLRTARKTRYGQSRVTFTAEQERMMGKVPEHEIAKLVGCSVRTVNLYRRRHGIAPYKRAMKAAA